MAATPVGVILRHLRQLVATSHVCSLGDRQLLERFTRHHDEATFEALMERHGAMVLGVCRRVLHDHHAAEDVFQATFLVLARDAGAIRRPESVGSWLFGVAYRLARRARMEAAKRHRHERQPRPMPAAEDPTAGLTWREVQQILDDELHRLPERFRVPLVLCYLEGKTQAEAAAQLGWSKGTLRRRLEQGQALLRRRLLRRDPTLATNHLAVVLAAPLAAPALPAALVLPTTRAAMRFVAGPSAVQEVIAPHVIALTDGVWPTLWATKLKMVAAALLLTVGLATAGMGFVGWPVTTATDSAGGTPETAVADQPTKDEQGSRTDRHGDALPPGALLRLGTVRFREKEEMVGVAFAPDGKVLVSGCSDGLLRLWDPATGKSVGQLKGHKDGLLAFAFSPDGKLLASTEGKAIYLREVATGKELHKIPCDVTFKYRGGVSQLRVAPIVFSPDGRLLASVAADHCVHVWEVATGKELLRLGPHAQEVGCLTFTPDGKRLISASGARDKRGTVYFWEVATGKEIRHIPIPDVAETRTTWPFAISPDGNTLAVEGLGRIMGKNANGVRTVSAGYLIRFIDLARGEERRWLPMQPSVIWSAVFAPDGKTMALATMDQTITVWDTATGKQRYRIPGYPGGMNSHGMQTLAFAPDGRTLASVESGSAIHLWNLTTGRELRPESEAHHSVVNRVIYSADGRMIASTGRDKSICLWDAVTGRLRVKLKGHTESVYALAFSPDGTTLASAATDQTVRLWNVATGKELHRLMVLSPPIGNGLYAPVSLGVAFTADGKALAVAGGDLKFRLLDIATGKELRQRPIHVTPLPKKPADKSEPDEDYSSQVHSIALSPDSRTIALATFKMIYVVYTATGEELLRLSNEGYDDQLVFSPDGQTLVIAGWDKTVRFWELATGKVALKVGGFDSINSVAFAPDGRRVALGVGWLNGKIHLLDAATGKDRRAFQGHGAYVPTLAFSPDATRLASGQRDSTVLVWDATSPVPHQGVPAAKLTPRDLDRLWAALADADASKAWTARWALIDRPDQAVPFLKGRLSPAAGKEFKRLEQLVADLDHEDFARREAASKELARRGAAIRPALRYALGRTNSAEARTRLQALLAQPAGSWAPSAETLRRLRAIQVLEQIGSPEASKILTNLARGSWTAPETQHARAAGDRLARRSQARR